MIGEHSAEFENGEFGGHYVKRKRTEKLKLLDTLNCQNCRPSNSVLILS